MKLLTVTEAAKALELSNSRILQFIYTKRLPAQKVGPIWAIKERDLGKVADRKTGRPGWLKKGK